jgi:hypothetical protein
LLNAKEIRGDGGQVTVTEINRIFKSNPKSLELVLHQAKKEKEEDKKQPDVKPPEPAPSLAVQYG